MNILVVGGGGREHAIVMKLAESNRVEKLYCAPGNGGISKFAECFPVKATDIDGIVDLAKKLSVDMVVVAPDDPLVMGMVDALKELERSVRINRPPLSRVVRYFPKIL